mmetsp:Transcript_10415/g.25511  ORF Transcript_10415/g.25511 Transcript_10415/m.25511 type:complete len:216 (+) Transcript_10415:207-854(+)
MLRRTRIRDPLTGLQYLPRWIQQRGLPLRRTDCGVAIPCRIQHHRHGHPQSTTTAAGSRPSMPAPAADAIVPFRFMSLNGSVLGNEYASLPQPAPLSPSFLNFKSSILLFAASSNFTSFKFFAAVVMALPIVLPISPTVTPLSSFSSSICRAFNLAALSSNPAFSSLNLAARSLAALVAGLDVVTEATMISQDERHVDHRQRSRLGEQRGSLLLL